MYIARHFNSEVVNSESKKDKTNNIEDRDIDVTKYCTNNLKTSIYVC